MHAGAHDRPAGHLGGQDHQPAARDLAGGSCVGTGLVLHGYWELSLHYLKPVGLGWEGRLYGDGGGGGGGDSGNKAGHAPASGRSRKGQRA